MHRQSSTAAFLLVTNTEIRFVETSQEPMTVAERITQPLNTA